MSFPPSSTSTATTADMIRMGLPRTGPREKFGSLPDSRISLSSLFFISLLIAGFSSSSSLLWVFALLGGFGGFKHSVSVGELRPISHRRLLDTIHRLFIIRVFSPCRPSIYDHVCFWWLVLCVISLRRRHSPTHPTSEVCCAIYFNTRLLRLLWSHGNMLHICPACHRSFWDGTRPVCRHSILGEHHPRHLSAQIQRPCI